MATITPIGTPERQALRPARVVELPALKSARLPNCCHAEAAEARDQLTLLLDRGCQRLQG